jgi:hypothetical protein
VAAPGGEHGARGQRVVAGHARAAEELLEGLPAGLPGLGLQDVEQALPPGEQQVVGPQQNGAAMGEAGRAPGVLGRAGRRRGIRHVVRGAQGQLVQQLPGEGREHGRSGGAAGRQGGHEVGDCAAVESGGWHGLSL